jgi:hypothetical protein
MVIFMEVLLEKTPDFEKSGVFFLFWPDWLQYILLLTLSGMLSILKVACFRGRSCETVGIPD